MKTKILLLLLVVSSLVGCTLLRESESRSKEKLLVAAGFQARAATTAKQNAALANLTPYRLLPRTKNGQTYYIYADPSRQCVYVGGAKEYAAYQKLAADKAEQMAANVEEINAQEWYNWGPWGGFGGVPMPERLY